MDKCLLLYEFIANRKCPTTHSAWNRLSVIRCMQGFIIAGSSLFPACNLLEARGEVGPGVQFVMIFFFNSLIISLFDSKIMFETLNWDSFNWIAF